MAKSGLFSALKDLQENHKFNTSGQCKLFLLLKEDSEESKEISAIIDNKDIPATLVSRVLKENGYEITPDSLRRHRNRANGMGCKCP